MSKMKKTLNFGSCSTGCKSFTKCFVKSRICKIFPKTFLASCAVCDVIPPGPTIAFASGSASLKLKLIDEDEPPLPRLKAALANVLSMKLINGSIKQSHKTHCF